MSDIAANTDTELFREPKGDLPSEYYANSLHKTADGRIGIDVGGNVWVMTLAEWHKAAEVYGYMVYIQQVMGEQ